MTPQSDHMSWRQALDLVDNLASPEAWTSHLSRCRPCSEQLEEARALGQALRFVAESQPDTALVERVLGRLDPYGPEFEPEIQWARSEAERMSRNVVVPQRQAAKEGLGSRLKGAIESFVHANLIADSYLDQAVGVRGVASTAPRTLVYETPGHTVSISFHPGRDPQDLSLDVIGQISPKEGQGLSDEALATLVLDSGSTVEVGVEPFGEFEFLGLDAHPVRLTVDFGSEQFTIGPFPELGVS